MNTEPKPAPPASGGVDEEVGEVIAACDGDAVAAVAAVRVLLVACQYVQAELAAREEEISRLIVDVSRGYARGSWQWLLERADQTIPYTPDD